MDLRRAVSLFLVALLVAVSPVSPAIGSVAAMGTATMDAAMPAAVCPHDHTSPHAPRRGESAGAKAAAFCHQHCAPAAATAVMPAPAEGSAPLMAAAPAFAVTPWIAGIDPPPPRRRA